jgi:hypothetical protein
MGKAKDKGEVREMVKKLHVVSPGVYLSSPLLLRGPSGIIVCGEGPVNSTLD